MKIVFIFALLASFIATLDARAVEGNGVVLDSVYFEKVKKKCQ